MRQSLSLGLLLALGLLAVVPVAAVDAVPPLPAGDAGTANAAAVERWPTAEIVPRVACRAEPEHTYALYLPSSYVPGRPMPILYQFDARQRGPFAAERFRAAAEELGYILASSNESRSDGPWKPNIDTMKAMWDDTHARFALDPRRVYAAGYSGGARTATLLALARPGEVAGVIGCGGGFPVDRPPDASTLFAFFGAAGVRDFNYEELRKLDLALAALGKAHRFEVFDGGHEWCSAPVATQALRWMNLLAMRDGALGRVDAFVEAEWRDQAAAAETLATAGDPLRAARRYAEMARDFSGLRDVAAAVTAKQRIEASAEHQSALAAEASAAREAEEYGPEAARILHQALVDPDSVHLPILLKQLRVPALQQRAADGGSAYSSQAARRLLEVLYVQTAYYVPTELEKKHDFARAALSLRVATAVKPEQPGGWYALACVLAPAGDKHGALAALTQAIEHGFDDAAALANEPALARIRGEKQFRGLLDQLKRRAAAG